MLDQIGMVIMVAVGAFFLTMAVKLGKYAADGIAELVRRAFGPRH